MKTTAVIMILLLLSSYVVAQEREQVGLDKLLETIEKNTAQQKKTTKAIEDLEPRLEIKFDEWSKKILGGNSVFMILIFLTVYLVIRVKKLTNYQTTQDYIRKLEKQLETLEKGLIGKHKQQTKQLQQEYNLLRQNNTQLINLIKNHHKQPRDYLKEINNIVIGVIIGIFLGVII